LSEKESTMSKSRALTPSLAQAHDELREEHQRLGRLVERVTEAADIDELSAALEETSQVLAAHFSHEERPDGLYDALGLCAPQHRERIRALVDDHYRMAATVRSLALRGRSLLDRTRELQRDAAEFVEVLRDHERREHALAREALDQEAPPAR
jgi:hemerythrin HHE cation binding domain-containing protein